MNVERYEALTALLARPDADGAIRAHRVTQPGHPDRFRWWADLPKVNAVIVRMDRAQGQEP